MDYGQTNKQDDALFFTPGAGSDNLASERPFEPENDINTGNFTNQAQIARDSGEIGRKAMSPFEKAHSFEPVPNNPPELGDVIDLAMPPGAQQAPTQSDEVTQNSTISASTAVAQPRRVDSDKDEIFAAQKAEVKLNQDENIASFYDEIRSMVEDNLKQEGFIA